MASAGACTGANQHHVRLAGGDDLVNQGIDGGTAAVDDALSADLDDCCIRQDAEVCRRLRGRLKLRVGQGALHEKRLQFRRRVGHKVLVSAASMAYIVAVPSLHCCTATSGFDVIVQTEEIVAHSSMGIHISSV